MDASACSVDRSVSATVSRRRVQPAAFRRDDIAIADAMPSATAKVRYDDARPAVRHNRSHDHHPPSGPVSYRLRQPRPGNPFGHCWPARERGRRSGQRSSRRRGDGSPADAASRWWRRSKVRAQGSAPLCGASESPPLSDLQVHGQHQADSNRIVDDEPSSPGPSESSRRYLSGVSLSLLDRPRRSRTPCEFSYGTAPSSTDPALLPTSRG